METSSAITMTSPECYTSIFAPGLLQGKTALVTGGGSGIGFEIAMALAIQGCNVVLMGRRLPFLEEAVQKLKVAIASYTKGHNIKVLAYAGDVRSVEDGEGAVDFTLTHCNRLDILVNSAAGNFLANANELKTKGFQTVMNIDTVGVFNMARAAFPALQAVKKNSSSPLGRQESERGGVIINISATLQYGATWFQIHASAAKSAIDSMTRSLGLEWGSHNIRVVGIAPGPIADTPGMTKLAPGVDTEAVKETVAEFIPIGRMGNKEDIAMMCLYLCSPAGTFITGETIVVDGGHWLYKPPMMPPDMVTEMSRQVESKSRAMGPGASSKPISKL